MVRKASFSCSRLLGVPLADELHGRRQGTAETGGEARPTKRASPYYRRFMQLRQIYRADLSGAEDLRVPAQPPVRMQERPVAPGARCDDPSVIQALVVPEPQRVVGKALGADDLTVGDHVESALENNLSFVRLGYGAGPGDVEGQLVFLVPGERAVPLGGLDRAHKLGNLAKVGGGRFRSR